MRLICSPAGIVNREYPGQGLLDIKEAGFEELLCDAALFFDEQPEKRYTHYDRVFAKCRENGLTFPVMALRCPAQEADRERDEGFFKEFVEEGLEVCEKTGCRSLLAPLFFEEVSKDRRQEEAAEFYLKLAAATEKSGVQILLRNQCRDLNGHLVRGFCCDGQEAAGWVDTLNERAGRECFGFCMDAGTCTLCGQNMYDFALALGSRLKAVILRDCDGAADNALLPFVCVDKGQTKTDWLNLIRGLREIGYDGMLILHFPDSARGFSPLLRPRLMELAKAVADYLKWQIELETMLKRYPSRVLFGAGNMCRNYMKCYGEKYPPLFTCDNNAALWGKEFCGLKVREPECLKELPADCAVLICNIYYREIEKQLREMGIAAPIVFFNDEYMPDFYFDRLEERV